MTTSHRPPSADASLPNTGDSVFLGAVLMLAAALRLYQLGAEGLWFDEANTAVLATLPISELIERISVDNQAPLYFLLVKAATALLGHAEWAVRSVSAAAGVALVWLAHDVGRRLLSRNAARWAAVLAATSPMAIHYSQEARPYALLMVLVLAGFSIGWRFDVQPTTVSALGLSALLWIAGGLRRSTFADRRAPILLSIFAVTPLIGMWLYSALAAAPIYLVGRVDSPALPVYLLLTATGSAALRWRWQWLGVAALVGLAILPLRVHWGIDFKSQERTIARVLDAHRVPDEPVITTAFDCSLIYYSGLQHGDTLLLYPSATEPYLGWVDWGGYDRASLERDAAEVAQRAVERASRTDSSRVWLLLHPDPRYAAIAAALATMMAPAGEFDFGYLGMKLRVYEPIEPSHD